MIELLAIIVILAIIAVITIPIILNVIDNSKRGAAIDSAYGYRDAIYKGFLTDLSLDSSKELPNGIYVIDNTGKLVNSNGVILTVNVSGIEPDDGWVELNKGEVVAFSLKFGDYVVTKYQDTEADAVKNGEIAENAEAREARLESERQTSAKNKAKTLATSQTGSTEIVEITEGWVAFINGEVKAYSLKVVEGDYTYVVTDMDVNTNNSNAVADRTISDVASTTQAEQLIINYYSNQVATEVASYISSLLADSTIQGYKEDTPKKVSEINTPSAPTGTDTNSWVYFKKETSSVSASDYSIKVTKGDYSFVVNCVDGTVSSPVQSTTIEPQKTNISIEVIKAGTTLATGDTIKLKWGSNTEEFKAILNDPNAPTGTTMLLAENNINTSTGYQGSNRQSYEVLFSQTNYWASYSDFSDIYDSTKTGDPGDNDYSVAYYVKMYVQNLQNLGFTGVNSGRILKKSEVDSGGIAASYKTSEENYWLGSAGSSGYEWRVYSGGNLTNDYHFYPGNFGVRPVIYISTSDIQ